MGFLFVKEKLCGELEDFDLLQVEDSSTSKGAEVSQIHSSSNFLSGSLGGDTSAMPDGVVCLIQAMRLPDRHMKIIRAQVDGKMHHPLAILSPMQK